MDHIDGGIRNPQNVSHVIVAVQALLHCPLLLEVITNDKEHQMSCKTLLRCLLCALHKVYVEMCRDGLADCATFAGRWKAISNRMTAEQQRSPLQVLTVFMNVMRMEFAMRNPKTLADDLETSTVASIWNMVMKTIVSCPSCGQYMRTTHTKVIELPDIVSDLKDSIVQQLVSDREEMCSQCRNVRAKISTLDITFPKCTIFHVDRCAPQFLLPYNLTVLTSEFTLNSMIVEPKDGANCFIITNCPDKRMRRFDETKISAVSPVTLYNAPFLSSSKLTLLYDYRGSTEAPGMVQQKDITKEGQKNESKQRIKIVSYPKLSNLTQTDSTPPPMPCRENPVKSTGKHRVATQTYQEVKHVAIQTVPYFSYEICKNNPKFKFYTGLEVKEFQALFNLIGGKEVINRLKMNYKLGTPQKIRQTKLSSEDKLLMFLLRLRRGLPLQELSEMFQISIGLVSELCYVMTRLIYLTFKAMEDDMLPTAVQQRADKPLKMKPFKNLRIILDGVSFFIERPSNCQQQGNTYSKYKAHNVIVFSVGISCNGATVFVSDGMEGSASDKAVILESGLLDRLQKGDGVMTDRGYELTAELQAKGCEFFKPPSLGERECFTKEEEIATRAIASARIYSEHAIADIKDNRLLQGVIPITLLPVLSDLVYIAAYLRNFSSSRIQDKRFGISNLSDPSKKGSESVSAVPSLECEDLPFSDEDWPF